MTRPAAEPLSASVQLEPAQAADETVSDYLIRLAEVSLAAARKHPEDAMYWHGRVHALTDAAVIVMRAAR